MQQKNQYANWWSKLLFKKKFENQFFIPVPASAIEEKIFKTIEKYKFNHDFSQIPITKPIFIVGLPRSGTSMLYNLLCAHEKAAYITNSINACPESICTIEWLRKKFNFNASGERFLADSINTDFGSPSEPALLWGKWMGRDVDSLYWEEKRLACFSSEKIQEIYTDVRRILFTFGGLKNNDKRFICKYPVMQTELRMVQDLFPDAHFIHIVRDSRPAANSLLKLYHLTNNQIKKIKHPWVTYIVPYPRVKTLQGYIDQFGADDIRTTANVWQDSIELVHQTAPDLKNFIEVRYEDILTNPSLELKRLFDFCELNWPSVDNKSFQSEFEIIGITHHQNNYKDFEVIESITGRMLKKLKYL
ncbi:MAG: sulfotransferase [Bacteriovorax sp.]|nr:sulfotransferase [Bacteriovorax sp.]